MDAMRSGEWWSLRMECCWRRWRRMSLRVEVLWRREECMRRGVAVASRGSELSRILSRAVEARLDVPAEILVRGGGH